MKTRDNSILKLAPDEKFIRFTEDEEKRDLALRRLMYKMDHAQRLADAKNDGLKEGIQQGIEHGVELGENAKTMELARKMLSENIGKATVMKITGLAGEVIDNLSV